MRRTLVVTVTAVILCCALALAIGCSAGVTNPDDDGNTETDLTGVTAQAGVVTTGQLASGTAGVNVTVTDSGAVPIAGLVVYLTPPSMGKALTSYPQAITDAQGQVGFQDVPIDSSLRVRVTLPSAGSQAVPVGSLTAGALKAVPVEDS
jgi:hypothetical protein